MTTNPQRIFTFRDLKQEWGWPYSRQHTHRLIKARRFPRPNKIPGGTTNIWTEQQIADYFAHIATTGDNRPAEVCDLDPIKCGSPRDGGPT